MIVCISSPVFPLTETLNLNKPLCSVGQVCTQPCCFELDAQDTNKTKEEEAVKHLENVCPIYKQTAHLVILNHT